MSFPCWPIFHCSAMRDGAYELYIKGLDELLLKHDSVMLEACNASFQTHFQSYNFV